MGLTLKQQDIAETLERNGITTKREALEFAQSVFGSTVALKDVEIVCEYLGLK